MRLFRQGEEAGSPLAYVLNLSLLGSVGALTGAGAILLLHTALE